MSGSGSLPLISVGSGITIHYVRFRDNLSFNIHLSSGSGDTNLSTFTFSVSVISISFIILFVVRLRDDYVLSTISSDPSLTDHSYSVSSVSGPFLKIISNAVIREGEQEICLASQL